MQTARTAARGRVAPRPAAAEPEVAADPGYDVLDTLGLSPRGRALNELEALRRLDAETGGGRPATVAEMFNGFTPTWAAEALARCERRQLVAVWRRTPSGPAYALTDTGALLARAEAVTVG